MVVIFALRFLRDDPKTPPTLHDSLDLQPGIHSVSPLRQRPMYFPFSTSGTPVTIQVNSFATSVSNSIIHHYDVVISPSEKTLPARMTMDLIRCLQFDVAPQIFAPTATSALKLSTCARQQADAHHARGPKHDGRRLLPAHPEQAPPAAVICAEVGSGALIPLELCDVPLGQLMRKQVPPEKTKDVLDFCDPLDRLQSIKNGLGTPRDGAWNMVDKKFFKPVAIERWVVVIYERQERFNDQAAQDMITAAMLGLNRPALHLLGERPGTHRGPVKVGGCCCCARDWQRTVVILPQGGNDIYTSVKHFEDITPSKCCHPKPQYYASVYLQINVKPGGINTNPDRARPVCSSTRTIGPLPFVSSSFTNSADVIHPVLLLNHRQRWLGNGASADCFSPRHDCAFDWAWFGRSRCAVRALQH
ncbi:hypothetical protein DFH08DRAFT_1086592 [Mycena albidolilacea]|uniref:Protein argonaute Mid domain-containing protein n=1 Tax=Mycena albidolilacea TaxID=1033008 RepID=A0AAD6ZD73_9AGAR|nr:hypothetical protein DFH08DRAFT_1086592 [Mycena albidolilacea]